MYVYPLSSIYNTSSYTYFIWAIIGVSVENYYYYFCLILGLPEGEEEEGNRDDYQTPRNIGSYYTTPGRYLGHLIT
jgi:hypothetical protein